MGSVERLRTTILSVVPVDGSLNGLSLERWFNSAWISKLTANPSEAKIEVDWCHSKLKLKFEIISDQN